MNERELVIKTLQDALENAENDGKIYAEIRRPIVFNTIALLKEQEAVKPKYIDGKRNHFILCGKCNTDLMRGVHYCSYCGQAVKWGG